MLGKDVLAFTKIGEDNVFDSIPLAEIRSVQLMNEESSTEFETHSSMPKKRSFLRYGAGTARRSYLSDWRE